MELTFERCASNFRPDNHLGGKSVKSRRPSKFFLIAFEKQQPDLPGNEIPLFVEKLTVQLAVLCVACDCARLCLCMCARASDLTCDLADDIN